jgi:hypothetical protein
MNSYKITFSDIKTLSELMVKGYDNKFVDYINSFEGDNTFQKFKNILQCWNMDVSPTINFNFNDRPTKIQVTYIISQLFDISDDIVIEEDDLKIIIGLPNLFQKDDYIPIYNIIKYISISGISINLVNLSIPEKYEIINNLPPLIYNKIYNRIIAERSKIFSTDSEALKDFKLNFLSNDIYSFLRGLFSNFDEYYFKDVIFLLSKRIDGNLLLQSTPLEVEYYIEKYSKEMDNQNENLNI